MINAGNDIPLRRHTCELLGQEGGTFNDTVQMPAVRRQALLHNGAGAYSQVETPFNMALSCNEGTAVDVTLTGTTMPGYSDVLKNTSGDSATDSVGVQVKYQGQAIRFGETLTNIVPYAATHETLNFTALYYYNGGALTSAGKVTATTTIEFQYH